MAHKRGVLDDFLNFASTSRSRSAVTLAAVSFAVCHLVVIATAPPSVTADLNADLPRQLVHFAAVFCRFVVPLGVMIVGMIQARSRPSAVPRGLASRGASESRKH
jgi:hypothetical protein